MWLGCSLSLEEVLLSDPDLLGVFFVGYRFEGPGLGEPPLAPFLLRMSCADLAPEALSVRLGFLTKHYIVDLLMKDSFQKGFNDICM